MELLQRLLDKIDRFELLIAGLVGAVVASRWHKDDLADWRAWLIFLITDIAGMFFKPVAIVVSVFWCSCVAAGAVPRSI